MRFLFYVISVWCVSTLSKVNAQSVMSFVPKGYTLLDSTSGDLNKDEIRDVILILKNDLEDTNGDTTRPLLILHGTKSKTYTLVAKNDHVVLCKNCGGVYGDPYESLVAKSNFFSVEHYGGSNWRWTRIITFKYDVKTKQYVLHRDAGISFHVFDPDKTTDIITGKKDYGKLSFEKYTNQ